MKKVTSNRGGLRWLWLTLIVIAVDQLSKQFVLDHLGYAHSIDLLPFLNITLIYNQGAAFSFLNQAGGWQQWFFSAIAVVVCIAIFIWLARLPRGARWTGAALALIAGGALGNLAGRLWRGHVVDFIDFHVGSWHWPVFNIADSCVVVGVIILVIITACKK